MERNTRIMNNEKLPTLNEAFADAVFGIDFAKPGSDRSAGVIVTGGKINWVDFDIQAKELEVINDFRQDVKRIAKMFEIPEGDPKPTQTFDPWEHVTHTLLRNSLEGSLQRCLAGRHSFLDRHNYERMYMNTPIPPITENAEFVIIPPKQLPDVCGE